MCTFVIEIWIPRCPRWLAPITSHFSLLLPFTPPQTPLPAPPPLPLNLTIPLLMTRGNPSPRRVWVWTIPGVEEREYMTEYHHDNGVFYSTGDIVHLMPLPTGLVFYNVHVAIVHLLMCLCLIQLMCSISEKAFE